MSNCWEVWRFEIEYNITINLNVTFVTIFQVCYWRFRRQLFVFRWRGTCSESSALCPRSDQKFFKVIANVYLDIRKAPDVNAERTGESLVFGTLDGPTGPTKAGVFWEPCFRSKWEFSWQMVMDYIPSGELT